MAMRLVVAFLIASISPLALAERVELSLEDAWQAAIDVLLDMDAYPAVRDEEIGVMKADPVSMQLDKTTADCGKMFGFRYIDDKRTKTSVAYSLRFKEVSPTETDVRVKVAIDGYMFTNETSWAVWMEKTRDANKVLQCKSTGALEKQFIDLLIEAA